MSVAEGIADNKRKKGSRQRGGDKLVGERQTRGWRRSKVYLFRRPSVGLPECVKSLKQGPFLKQTIRDRLVANRSLNC